MARNVHAELALALDQLKKAERAAVLLFGEIMVNELYRELGFATMEQYAEEKLGFSASKRRQFMRLARRLDELPALKKAVETGDIGWTAAREVQRVATPESEDHWVNVAKTSSRRELRKSIAQARTAADRRRKQRRTGQVELVPAKPASTPDPARSVTLTFTGEQYDRYLALLEARRRSRAAISKEELILEALDAAPASSRRARQPHHRIVTVLCPSCGKANSPTPRGDRELSLTELAARMEDAEIVDSKGRVTRTIPPSVRSRVLARDGYRCQAAGCRHTRFLEVHHIVPRSEGGTNRATNLVTLCGHCHRALHRYRAELLRRQRDTRRTRNNHDSIKTRTRSRATHAQRTPSPPPGSTPRRSRPSRR